MNILAINGSYRGENGYTQHLVGRLFSSARQAGAQCQSITLAKLKINRCLACNTCQKNALRLPPTAPGAPADFRVRCIHAGKDDTRMVFERMAQADLIIYATPVYVFNISVLLKTLFDRAYGTGCAGELIATRSGLMFHHIDRTIFAKPFVPLIVCDNLEYETPRTLLGYFEVFSKFLDAPMVGRLVRNGGALSGHGGDPGAEERLPALRRVYAAYARAGFELATSGRISPRTQRAANREIVPVPLFALLKRIHLRPLKQKFIERAEQYRADPAPAKHL